MIEDILTFLRQAFRHTQHLPKSSNTTQPIMFNILIQNILRNNNPFSDLPLCRPNFFPKLIKLVEENALIGILMWYMIQATWLA